MNSRKSRVPVLALIVSIIALILTQFRPLYTYLDTAEIKAFIPKNIAISQFWGSIRIDSFIQITNEGKDNGTITRIDIFLQHQDSNNYTGLLPSVTYSLKPSTYSSDQMITQVPIGHIVLEPGESFDHQIMFYELPSRERQKEIAQLQLDLQKELSIAPINRFAATPIEASDSTKEKIDRLIESKLNNFVEGEYYLLFAIWSEKDQSLPTYYSIYSFSVFEPEINELNQITERFKSGEGVITPMEGPFGFNSLIYQVQDEKAKNDVLKAYIREVDL